MSASATPAPCSPARVMRVIPSPSVLTLKAAPAGGDQPEAGLGAMKLIAAAAARSGTAAATVSSYSTRTRMRSLCTSSPVPGLNRSG